MSGLRGRQAWRALTEGEIAMASLLFGDAIDYARVRIYRRRYLPFGLQPRDCAMTPNGHLYFHHSRCLLDFSTGSEQARHWFMHEMTSLWWFAHRSSRNSCGDYEAPVAGDIHSRMQTCECVLTRQAA
jgi:hypothetical protein